VPASQSGWEFIEGWIAAEDFCAGPEDLWGSSALPGGLLFIWKCVVALLREGFLGLGGGFYSVKSPSEGRGRRRGG
jgi:hypothetical protein